MSGTENDNDGPGFSLEDLKANKLRDVAYSAGLDHSGKKKTLIGRLRAKGVSYGPEGWEKEGDPFEVEARPTNAAPAAKTILYAFEREATPEDFVDDLKELAGEHGYEVARDETEGTGKATLKIIDPPEEE